VRLFGHNRHGPKSGGAAQPPPFGGAGYPSNTMWPGPRLTSVPSRILIHPTVWPQDSNVTRQTDKQRSDSIWRTILQMVAQKLSVVLLFLRNVFFTAAQIKQYCTGLQAHSLNEHKFVAKIIRLKTDARCAVCIYQTGRYIRRIIFTALRNVLKRRTETSSVVAGVHQIQQITSTLV